MLAPANQVNGGKPLTLAVFSCSRYQDGMLSTVRWISPQLIVCSQGYFNAYGVAAHNTSADVFVHLGDYVSEAHVPRFCVGTQRRIRSTNRWATGRL